MVAKWLQCLHINHSYLHTIAFPLCVTGFLYIFTILLTLVLGVVTLSIVLLLGVFFGFLGWLAIGHELEVRFRAQKKIPSRLLFSFVALVMSYSVLYNGLLNFIGVGDPTSVTWGMMLQWCFTSRYTFIAPHW
ncbi:MAG: hypothetical protein AYK19_16410 [Theionarchaea archaeon DG-70-1]|nr:MAG: hypothetical protein AYK19_16410 [Theionarchaea archaeon DG-70-1]